VKKTAASSRLTNSDSYQTKNLPELLRNKRPLMSLIAQDLRDMGLVGENENGKLTCIGFTSRLQRKPLNIVFRGTTGAGKSTVSAAASLLFPKESKIEAMRLTDASLFNGPSDFLTHKILLTGERKHAQDDTTRDANAMIRQLLSEGRVTRTVSVREGRTWVTETQERKGPIAYCESTTAGSIFEEDLNRLIQLFVDESEEQTRRVMLARAAAYGPGAAAADPDKVIARHHEFQEWLQDQRVPRIVIPFHRALAETIPAGKTMCRRVIDQVLTVIETITLMHQHQRELRDGVLLATLEDYQVARELLLAPLHQAIGVGDSYQKMALLKKKLPKGQFDSNQAMRAAGFSNKMTRDRKLKELAELGVLKCVAAGSSHRPARWAWAARSLDELVLPSVATLEKTLQGSAS
jgi:hypothetical protein